MNLYTIYSPGLTKRILASGAIGNILETYDLILIALMATTLSQTFFPPAVNPYAHVVSVLYVFLIGLLVRPIGNVIMGVMADYVGRKKIMIISLVCTGIGTISIGILPGYSCIGVWSTVLFVFLRIFQNFFAGIEYINSASYLIETSVANTRGFFASWTAIGISGGYLFASIISLMVAILVKNGFLPAWGWRFVFIFSATGVAFGLWLRRAIPESLSYIVNANTSKRRTIFMSSINYITHNPVKCLSIAGLTLMGICLTFIYYIYIPINLSISRHLSQIEMYTLNSGSLLVVVLLIPFFGKISDYINRYTLLKFACIIVLCLSFPFFWLCSYGSYVDIVLITILMSIPASCFFSIYPAIITECFPPSIRCTTASLIYQVIVSIEMGSLPLLTNYLIKYTNISYSPVVILIISTLIGYVCLVYLKAVANECELLNSDYLFHAARADCPGPL